ncbi:Apolipoprotein N-acyltransferase [Zhongshania aliphaticivorans]|uniref:Apolipoprotein N-acyltransferase n=1 Tax=Zhongshania aliphaticivorans TaxID=1470434 RepID=A0A5S9N1P8_9GAMM|nr:apolipoprotein N-acyltransferase [Zhongshania aliphaticivorans]CAA0083028.1 Apolipoprotein N-acyltransferase [Zhongshania aliphaticivorans]CAA0083762.1 Apolipoprotein N-acyltransferase [Zhongshania aliphaticivorans]
MKISPYVFVAIAGASLTLSLAPFNWWWSAIIAMAALSATLNNSTTKQGFLLGWCFGSASFATGVSWVYIAIHDFGGTSTLLAVPMTAIFCIGLGLIPALFAYAYIRWIRAGIAGKTLGFAALWVLTEWLRGWLFTGFPWLYLGYGHLHTAMAGWSPVTGVYGISFWVALSGAAVAQCIVSPATKKRHGITTLGGCIILFGLGYSLQKQEWTSADDRAPLKIGAVQANISQDKKWAYTQYWATLEKYDHASETLWPTSDLVIWPEAAIPALYHNALSYFDYIAERAEANNSALITGVPTRTDDDMFNSVMVISGGDGIYHKQRLVPFGEYVPLGQYIRGLINFFDLPMSSFSRGGPNQNHLHVKGWQLAPSICYEIAYPDLIARSARNSDVLFTISNDAWFGNSIGPDQHMQMAQMRALENGRELIRVTGTGITAIVDHHGNIRTRIPSFIATTMQGEVHARNGSTPFTRFGSTPIIALCAMLAITAGLTRSGRRIKSG